MKKIGNIDAGIAGRSLLSDAARKKTKEKTKLQQKEEGYEQLRELCCLGEYDFAQQLANRYPQWGYEILDGNVVEKIEDS